MARNIISRIRDVEALTYALFPRQERRDRKYFQVGDTDGNPGKSCTVWPAEGRYHEFNGGESGDVVDILGSRLKTDVPGVIRWLQDNGWMEREAARRSPPVPQHTEPPKLRMLHPAPADAPLPSQETLLTTYRQYPDNNPLTIDDGQPVQLHLYRTMRNHGLLLVVRYPVIKRDGSHDKAVRRWSWDALHEHWQAGGTKNAAPPLYRLPAWATAAPSQPILVVEGERTAEQAAEMSAFGNYLATCAVGGSNPASGTDWTPVAGRSVYVLPDADPPGNPSRAFPRKVMDAAMKAGANFAHIVNPQLVFEKLGGSGKPPKGWDVADAQQDCSPLDLSAMTMTLDEWRRRGAKTRLRVEKREPSPESQPTSAADMLRQSLDEIIKQAESRR